MVNNGCLDDDEQGLAGTEELSRSSDRPPLGLDAMVPGRTNGRGRSHFSSRQRTMLTINQKESTYAGVAKALVHGEAPLMNAAPTSAIAFVASHFPTPTPSPPPPPPVQNNTVADRPLILYAFFETPGARLNLEFFIRHALHDAADFLFVLNGDTSAANLLPERDNIRFVKRANDCYDLGAFAEILTQDDMYKNYNRYILMNASIRGPFMPSWSGQCWSDVYLDKLSDTTKVCRPIYSSDLGHTRPFTLPSVQPC